jgi:asparagine synthetase B (glutamine-hydrolysing)
VYDKFKVTVGPIDKDYYKTSNWLQEQYRTADLIYKDFGKDLIILFSGGTDSEIVVRAFNNIGIKPKLVFIKFANDYNINDLIIAQKITTELGLSLEVIEFDVVDFYKSGQAFEFASVIHCRQIAYLTVYHHILKLQSPAIMGGEMLLRQTNNHWYYCFRENEDASAMRFSMKYNIPLVNEWFSYTPEMMGYYLDEPVIQDLINNKIPHKLSSVSTKNQVLKSLMPELIDKTKTHGYEKLMGLNIETYNSLYRSHTKRLEHSLDGIYIEDLNKLLFGHI